MIDGNKRLGAHVMLIFLALNGYELSYSQKDLSNIILALASGEREYCNGLLSIKNKFSLYEIDLYTLIMIKNN